MDDDSEIRITLRLPAKLRDRLSAAADANSRSMNGEIVFRLEDWERVSSELDKTEKMLTKREEALFTDRVELRNIKPQVEDFRRQIQDQKREISDLRLLVEQQSIVIRMTDAIRKILDRIIDEAGQGRDDTIRMALENRSKELTPAQEADLDRLVDELENVARRRAGIASEIGADQPPDNE